MTDQGSLLDRLGAASMEAKETLRELHTAAKDLRALLREMEQAKRDMRNYLDALGPAFQARIQEALSETVPQVATGVEDMIKAYDRTLEKHFTDACQKLQAAITEGSNILKGEMAEARTEFKQSKEASDAAREHAYRIADLMDSTYKGFVERSEALQNTMSAEERIRAIVREELEEYTH